MICFLRVYLLVAEITTNWQKKLRRKDSMVAVYATTAETSVLTLLLKHAQLFTRAKLNPTVWCGRKKHLSVKSFCLEHH